MNQKYRLAQRQGRLPDIRARCAMTVMAKAPRAGQVKTRLIPLLTPEEAAALSTCFLRDMCATINLAGQGADKVQGFVCYTPPDSEETLRDILPHEFRLLLQRDGSFGNRLAGAIEDLLAVGFGSVCLINSDSPTAPPAVFADAIRLLSQPGDQIVLGPSDDGGYYLIGMKKLEFHLFEKIDWSTDRVFHQTQQRAGELGLGVHTLPYCYDVDDPASFQRLCTELLGSNQRLATEVAPATRQFLCELIARAGSNRFGLSLP